ncbi:MAG: TonB-dependent receptor, partial [Candidatus Marinimicrobia bacterium]|nr:TonB-dependent receptor [Candidatus Neomarinimicrobiota bacterium]
MKRISQLVTLVALMSFTWAQTTGKISGTVSSSDGQTLAGANVIIDGTSMGAATDANGKYNILNVTAGTYSVTVNYIGYKNTTVSNVQAKSGLTTPMNFALESSVIAGEAVTIVGTKRLVEPSATNSVRIVGSDEIMNSATRSVTGLLEMQAGVTITNGDLHIRGSREEEVAYTIDGADIKDVVNSGRMASAIPEALSE